MKLILAIFTLAGFNFVFWSAIGISRFVSEKLSQATRRHINLPKGLDQFFKKLSDMRDQADSILVRASVIGLVTTALGMSVAIGGLILVHSLFSFVAGLDSISAADLAGDARYILATSLLWMFFGVVGGYITVRTAAALDLRSTLTIGSLYTIVVILLSAKGEEGPVFNVTETLLTLAVSLTVVFFGSYLAHIVLRLERRAKLRKKPIKKRQRLTLTDVAIIVPAHNEEALIRETIKPLKRILPRKNIYVASDGSTDKTVKIARSLGVRVADIHPNRGKASALVYTLERFDIYKRYQAVLFVDADSQVDEHYLERALPLFDDPEVVAVAGHAYSRWRKHNLPKWSMLFTAYRTRLYWTMQAIMRYAQTWKYFNVTPIVPGFASMYRTRVLSKIDITAPGLVIEDFNMTFEIHHKKLGKIAYSPRVYATSQDPCTLRDYIKQVVRWNLGFWQTVRRHGIWPSLFWVALLLFVFEVLTASFFFLLVPFVLLWFAVNAFTSVSLPVLIPVMGAAHFIEITLVDVLIGVFLVDYALTVIVAVARRQPLLLFYGIFFVAIRIVDAFIMLYALPLAFITRSDGKWVSPKRV